MKKTITALFFALLLGLCALALTACGEPQPFEGESLAPGEVRVNVLDGTAYVRWAAYEGADEYRIYKSDTRFGNYFLAKQDGVRETRFESGDAYCYYKIKAVAGGKEIALGEPVSAFSAGTLIVGPDDDMAAVQSYIDEKHALLESGSTGQFSDLRLAVMFLPGAYPQIEMKTGYYTSVMGLGGVPTDVVIGSLYVSTKVLSNNNSTCTFWRGVENVTIDGDTQWAVSQATAMRRVQINGDLALSHPTGYSSGGFLANSRIEGTVNPGTQQQWMSRNDEWGEWLDTKGSHNLVFSGCAGRTPASAWSDGDGRYTNIETTAKMAEKPFLTYDGAEGYGVFVPDTEEKTQGITWADGNGKERGSFVSLDDFYVASEKTDSADTLNEALAAGKHLLLTPGHYKLDKALNVTKAGTVVLGMGYATLEIADNNADCALRTADVGGIRLANFLVDAGPYSKNMVVVGTENGRASHAADPAVLSDIFLRIGGVANVHTETDTAMVINADDTIGDNFWIWRADHSRGVAWNDTVDENGKTVYGNPVQTGLRVNGDNVSCYALMVEHCEDYQTYWKGENGLTVMYQSETPYRVPDQSLWMSHDGAKFGCASYKVDDGVTTHTAYGLGVYWVNYGDVRLSSAIEVPVKEGVRLRHLVTCDFTSAYPGSIDNVVNDTGGAVGPDRFRRLVVSYPAG